MAIGGGATGASTTSTPPGRSSIGATMKGGNCGSTTSETIGPSTTGGGGTTTIGIGTGSGAGAGAGTGAGAGAGAGGGAGTGAGAGAGAGAAARIAPVVFASMTPQQETGSA